ncbi:CBS domain-containing protein [Mechercharimyces sp. CAU 1602]|uniref:CBS domain-containing protein n=1 Tax=Mechercharimyces sp. CAU 1602 TaxID=2973933 RepID=UPI00216293FD|nr:CBS domain-containing protein [Mechercharimyces sp. CAU 1602]MCS1352202.1 CBS domain-containing protein [Mechercharimyces sp. CAU 1602]
MIEDARYLFSQEIAPLVTSKEQAVTVRPEWSLDRALLVLTRRGYSSVPVISAAGTVEGIISKTHILDFMLTNHEIDFSMLKQHAVHEAMDINHGAILPNSIFSFAFEVLTDRSYIPVTDIHHQFIGVLTRKAVMQQVTDYFQKEFLRAVTGSEVSHKVTGSSL